MARSSSGNRRALLLALCAGLALRSADAAPAGCSGRRLIKTGIELLNRGRYGDAIDKLGAAHACDERLSKALLLMGAAHLRLGHFEDGLGNYERFAADPHLRAPDRARLPDYFDEAARLLEDAHGADPTRAAALLFAGRARHRSERVLEALGLYERYAAARPADADPAAARFSGYLADLRRDLKARIPEPPTAEDLEVLRRLCALQGDAACVADVDQRLRALRPAPTPTPTIAALPQKPPVQPAPPAPAPRPTGRPLWRVLGGAGAIVVGGGLLGFGASALAQDGVCLYEAFPFKGCSTLYNTLGVGVGLTVSGAVVIAAGAALIAWPPRRPAPRPRGGRP